jgi:hypothetical protein
MTKKLLNFGVGAQEVKIPTLAVKGAARMGTRCVLVPAKGKDSGIGLAGLDFP